jgi:hypothetical protein
MLVIDSFGHQLLYDPAHWGWELYHLQLAGARFALRRITSKSFRFAQTGVYALRFSLIQTPARRSTVLRKVSNNYS